MGFNGFISYSHAADGRLAPAVQRGLHRLAKPWHRRRALWIFRDQTGLAVTPTLWSSIQRALDGSEYFVLLASPEAARSPWVNREIEHWTATKSANRILPVVTDGEWQWDPVRRDFTDGSTAVPAALRGVFAEEPLYLDLRWARDDLQLNLRHSRFRDAIAQLAAPMHGVSKDDLEGEDVRQHRRVRRLQAVAVTTLVVLALLASLTGALAVRNAARANALAGEARHQQQVALEQRRSAERFADEARRQEESARQQEARAKEAAEEARRQDQLAREQRERAGQASAEARRQQGLADQAAARAREQEGLAQRQRAAAQRSAEHARRQEELARQHEARASEAAAEASRQQGNAREQQRIAIAQRLMNEAKATIDTDPKTALMLGLAAQRIRPDAATRAELLGLVTSTLYAGTISQATAVAYGSTGVLATEDSETVSLWNVANRANPVQLATLDGHSPRFSPDGRTLVLLDPQGAASLWDVANPGRPARIGPLPDQTPVDTVAFSPDRRTLATAHWDPELGAGTTLWDVTERHPPTWLARLPAEVGPEEIVFSPDGRTMVTRDFTSTVSWDVTNRAAPVRRADLDDSGVVVASVAFHPKVPVLATGTSDGTVILWDLNNPAQPQRTTTAGGLLHSVLPVAFSADGNVLAAGDRHGATMLWDVEDLGRPLPLNRLTNQGEVGSMVFSPDSRMLVTTDRSGDATLRNVANYGAPEALAHLAKPDGRLVAMALHSDGRSLATVSAAGKGTFWSLADRANPVPRASLPVHNAAVLAAAVSSDGNTVAGLGEDGTVTLSNVADPTRPVTLATFPGEVRYGRIAFSPDGRTLAIPGVKRASLWDLTNPTLPTRLAMLPADGDARAMAFSPDGHTLAVGGYDRTVTLWNVTNRANPVRLAVLPGLRHFVTSVAFSPDGRTLAVGDLGHTAVLWDVADRSGPRRLATLGGAPGGMVAFSQDGRTLASSHSAFGTTTLWSITERAKPVRLTTVKSNGFRKGVVFSPDGRTLVVAGDDGAYNWTVTLWDYAKLTELRADPARHACAITGRALTADEWDRYIPELQYQAACPAG